MAEITVKPKRTMLHNGTLYDASTTITDEESKLKQALDSGACVKVDDKKAGAKKTAKD